MKLGGIMLFRYLTFIVILNLVSLSTENCITTYENEYPKNNDFEQYNVTFTENLVEHFGFDRCAQNPIKFLLSQYPEEVQINTAIFCVPIFIKIENNINLILSDQIKIFSINFATVNNSGDVIINKTEEWQYFIIKYSDTNLQIFRDEQALITYSVTFNSSVKIFSTTRDKSKLKFQQYDAYTISSINQVTTSIALQENSCFYMAWRLNYQGGNFIQINGGDYLKDMKFWTITKTCCNSSTDVPIIFKGKGYVVKNSIITQKGKKPGGKHNRIMTTTTPATKTNSITTNEVKRRIPTTAETTTPATKTIYMTTTEARITISTNTEIYPKKSETNIIIYLSISIIVLAIVVAAFVFKCIKQRDSVIEKKKVGVSNLYCKPDNLKQWKTDKIYSS